MPDDPHLTDGECAETTFIRLIIVRDVWLPGVKRWMKEYVGRNLPGELTATSRRFAEVFNQEESYEADKEMRLAQGYLHHPRATPWRIGRVKVTVRRRIRQGEPKDEDFARSLGLLTFPRWASALGFPTKKSDAPS